MSPLVGCPGPRDFGPGVLLSGFFCPGGLFPMGSFARGHFWPGGLLAGGNFCPGVLLSGGLMPVPPKFNAYRNRVGFLCLAS